MSELIDRQAAIEKLKSYIVDPEKAISENPDDVFQYNSGIRTAVGVIMELRTSSPWHRVEEELPEVGKYVLAWEWGKFAIVDKWCGDKWGLTEDGAEYTHWMPLPEPPKEEN